MKPGLKILVKIATMTVFINYNFIHNCRQDKTGRGVGFIIDNITDLDKGMI